jgi:homoserine dehydrogenase
MFEEHSISVETMLQRPSDGSSANLLISTHLALENDIQSMIKEIELQTFVNNTPTMIRIV